MNAEKERVVQEVLEMRERDAVAKGKKNILFHVVIWMAAIMYAAYTSMSYGSYSKILITLGVAACASIFIAASNNRNEAKKKEEVQMERQARKTFIDDAIKNKEGFSLSQEARDGDEKYSIAIDEKHKNWMLILADQEKSYLYHFDDLIDYEVHQDGDTIISGNSGEALLGGMVFGAVGAIAGASGAKSATQNCTDLHIDIFINDVQHLQEEIMFVSEAVTKQSLEYQYAVMSVKEVIAVLSYIKANSNENAKALPVQEIEDNSDCIEKQGSDEYKELEKLFELKKKGIITEEEFVQKKKQILNLL